MKRACVIGAGLGGLALAIRLQSAGVPVTLIEAREQAGGWASATRRKGFTFNSGPGAIVDPEALEELWRLSGQAMSGDIALTTVEPAMRFNWPDGTNFDYSSDPAALRREIARIAPGDAAGYEDFARFAAQAQTERLRAPFAQDLRSMANAVPGLTRGQAWRSLHSAVARHLGSEKLRQAFTAGLLLTGGNPMTASALHAAMHALEQAHGAWWPAGGPAALARALSALFVRLGGALRLKDPVLRIHTLGDRVSEVECASGWQERFDAVASNADVVHTYRDLLAAAPRGGEMARKLVRRRFSPGLFTVHFGVEGSWPGVPHRMVLFPQRYKELLADIFEHGVLPRDFILFLDHASLTDPSLAPPGKSTFRATIPVANLGKLPIDWDHTGPLIEQRLLEEVGRRLIPDLDDRIVTRFHTTPRDTALDMNAYLGSAFGLEPLGWQSLFLRPQHRDAKLANLFLVGAGAAAGAGVPAVLAGAKVAAGAMLEELR